MGSYRYDAKQLLRRRSRPAAAMRGDAQGPKRIRAPRRGGRWLSLTVIGAGAIAFCYGIAVAASLFQSAAAVTRLGVPLMLAGLFGLVFDLLLQVIAMRRESRSAVDRMHLVELRLREYRQAALLVGRAEHNTAHALRAPKLSRARLDDPELGFFELVPEHF